MIQDVRIWDLKGNCLEVDKLSDKLTFDIEYAYINVGDTEKGMVNKVVVDMWKSKSSGNNFENGYFTPGNMTYSQVLPFLVPGGVLDLEEKINNYSYGIGWKDDAGQCDLVGNIALLRDMPIQNSLQGYIIDFKTGSKTVTEDNQSITYGAEYQFNSKFKLNSENWLTGLNATQLAALTTGTPLDSGNTGSNIMIHNDEFWYKSFKHIYKNGTIIMHIEDPSSTYNEVRIATRQIDETWHHFKAGYTSFGKAFVVNDIARCFGNIAIDEPNSPLKAEVKQSELSTILSTNAPSVGLSREVMHTKAKNGGAHQLSFDEYKMLFYWLPAIELGTFQIESNSTGEYSNSGFTVGTDYQIIKAKNCSSWITNHGGSSNNKALYPMCHNASYANFGKSYNYLPNGLLNTLGNNTGWGKLLLPNANDPDAVTTDSTATYLAIVRYRGFDNFRNIWTNCHGASVIDDNVGGANAFYATNNRAAWNSSNSLIDLTKSRLCGNQVQVNGFIGEFVLGDNCDLIPSSATNHKFDSCYYAAGTNQRCVIFGGFASYGANGGPGYLTSLNVAAYATSDVGFRIRVNEDEYESIYN